MGGAFMAEFARSNRFKALPKLPHRDVHDAIAHQASQARPGGRPMGGGGGYPQGPGHPRGPLVPPGTGRTPRGGGSPPPWGAAEGRPPVGPTKTDLEAT